MIIALLLETSHPHLAEKMTYVAGDRVVTDPVCKPFSMGRNLVCVYSKKHMHDILELAEMKKKANTLSLKEMALLFKVYLLCLIPFLSGDTFGNTLQKDKDL
ncbi:glycerol-3-phosphate acyltransferase ATS11, chloroplastic-like [Magnolia sinica]|uniref:glycerol-3-phosphate acyltransferase ATS11, chloroplastic-like n=1 Tax=Magnolia sinica TaxID=86752 RepID=UPI00265949AD|nr:glycerol-3-phosphate acyltransferase ATS11, chloroplastic-like [Magnolia sinica]